MKQKKAEDRDRKQRKPMIIHGAGISKQYRDAIVKKLKEGLNRK